MIFITGHFARAAANLKQEAEKLLISSYLNPYVCVWADRGRGAVCWLGKNKKGEKKKRNTGGEKGKDKYILYEERWIINFLLWVVREKEWGGRGRGNKEDPRSKYI